MQPISNQTDQTIDLLQEEKKSEIFQGYGGKEPIVFKMKRKPAQTEPVTGAASSEEQPQVGVTVDAVSTQNTEEEMQSISSQTDLTLTPHVKTSVTEEEEVEKLSEETVDVASTQNTEEEMQQIS
ncbi:unnamed protein product [Pleuronectes platessa]|uniref:Uncharacterized protein n=1 Tax=Pleuronectes platessa TaxID=8262 RepID=A0A9N7VVV7_PLEPL|nr:unnamed protein product [Pleuronectes platessa]